MEYSIELLREVTTAVREITGLRQGAEYPEHKAIALLGLTRHNFNIIVRYFVKDGVWCLRIEPNGKTKGDLLLNTFGGLCETSEFSQNGNKRVQFEVVSGNIDLIIEQAELLRDYAEENGLGHGSGVEAKTGVNFIGTQFDRLKERGATISGMFGNLVCQASGMNLLMMQAEYYVDAGEIDGIEFNEADEVISIYECQSGIHKGAELDDEHTMKVLGSYLYDPEIIPTVRKVVILAGAYSESDRGILRERAYELSRREKPIELVALITTREDNRIGVERVDL